MQNNYFVCTLGHATALSSGTKPYRTISEFVRHQAQNHPQLPAVGFAVPKTSPEEWDQKVLTFTDVEKGSKFFALRLSEVLITPQKSETIALLCHSSPEFLFTWLALMRLGHSVLLIAPQCQPAAIVHLCMTCKVSVLFHDIAHTEKALQTSKYAQEQGQMELMPQSLPLAQDESIFDVISEAPHRSVEPLLGDEKATAYLHHTSGTSSGLPKPIPQSHAGAIGVLPSIPKLPAVASFTTTPLYHGGIADLFRCWTSNAMIWLFPSKDVPITARNICKCLDVARAYSSMEGLPQVKYFSSVPYILQMMETDDTGLKMLQYMDIVGVGGAALPADVGNHLVQEGVKLISRFGSAECGFLLSSYRDFSTDKDWQYLRNYNPENLLKFEPREDGLSELVIKPGWPHMAKTNRPDGSFATADLFVLHPSIKDAWMYHSRADSQLTLITGKKFDPAPLEDALSTSPLLDDVLIFGNNHPFPGALLFRSAQSSDISNEDLLHAVQPTLERLNGESQDHARIPFTMLVPVAHQTTPLEKSSKGTIIRRAAEARFEKLINGAYDHQDRIEEMYVSDEELPQYLTKLIQIMTGKSQELDEHVDLFSYGVDSIACMQLRDRLRRLIPNYQGDLPMSIVEDCGTTGRLTDFILRKRHGKSDDGVEDEDQLMLDLVEEFGVFERQAPRDPGSNTTSTSSTGQVVVLTGASGALGGCILDLLQKQTDVCSVYCLVRGADEHAARERVNKSLEQKGLVSLTSSDKVKVVPAQLSEERLGLSEDMYNCLAREATSIIHVAWTVNFRLRLRSFIQDNIAGVKNLLELALQSPRAQRPRFTYCSSTAAIMNGPLDSSSQLAEKLFSNPSVASPLGYSRSKWVAEHICLQAHERTSLHGRIAVVRVGQLAGDSRRGVWNTKEAWPLDWLPVDVAAQAFLQATQADAEKRSGELPVYHVLNPHRQPTWREMLPWLQKKEGFEVVSPKEWVKRLEATDKTEHPALKLLGLWKESYGRQTSQPPSARPLFSLEETGKNVLALRDVKPVDEAYTGRVWDWIQENVR